MRKSHREAERLLREMGFTILASGKGKHHWWRLRSPSGREFKQPIPHNTEAPNFWGNWKSQLRKHLTPGQAEARNLNQLEKRHD